MGIDICGIYALSPFLKNKFKHVLTIGRQQIHLNNIELNNILSTFNLSHVQLNYNDYCEELFTFFGSEIVDSIDVSKYENCSIIHDLNYPININKKYNFIYDGGCSEHIFNCPQAYQNFINLLDINGIFLGIVPNNNFSGHGFYQFSPEFFIQVFSDKYGMKLIDLYLAKINTPSNEWMKLDGIIHFRNETKFNDNEQVYIIVIAKKIKNGKNLIENPPQQHNYENIDWKV